MHSDNNLKTVNKYFKFTLEMIDKTWYIFRNVFSCMDFSTIIDNTIKGTSPQFLSILHFGTDNSFRWSLIWWGWMNLERCCLLLCVHFEDGSKDTILLRRSRFGQFKSVGSVAGVIRYLFYSGWLHTVHDQVKFSSSSSRSILLWNLSFCHLCRGAFSLLQDIGSIPIAVKSSYIIFDYLFLSLLLTRNLLCRYARSNTRIWT